MRSTLLLLLLAGTAHAAPATTYVAQHQAALDACAPDGAVTARATLRWNAGGQITSVRVTGGSAAFRRCAQKALAGTIARKRAGRGRARFTAGGTKDLQACQVDADCTLHFQTDACVEGDPVAVSTTADPAAVARAFPVRTEECAMGGPQYEQLRMENEGRWSAACEQARCVVHDAGPRKSALP